MKQIQRVIGGLLTLLLLFGAGWFLIGLLQNRTEVESAQQLAITPEVTHSVPTPISTSALDWATVTLDQIHFGEPKVVFSHNDNIRIYDWLPDNRRLLLAIADPEKTEVEELVDRNRLVTLDTQTGEIVEYGRYPNEYHPVWLESVQGIAYPFIDVRGGGSPEVRLGLGNGRVETIDNVSGRLDIDSLTNSLFYVAGGMTDNTLKRYDATQHKAISSSFLKDDLPWGYLHIDPAGRWMVTFRGGVGYSPMYLADRSKGTVTELSFDSWWPIDAAWSRDGSKLALILSTESRSQLAIFDPQTTKWEFVDLPVRLVTEIEWAPKRYLLVKGVPSSETSNYHKFWLVDTLNGDFQETKYFTPTMVTDNIFWAWSDKGDVAWLDGDQIIITQVILKEGQ